MSRRLTKRPKSLTGYLILFDFLTGRFASGKKGVKRFFAEVPNIEQQNFEIQIVC
jgi:hypothetical protein